MGGASLTAPSGPAGQQAVYGAVRDAGIVAADVDVVDCHGIGAILADAVEVCSLERVLRGQDASPDPLLLESVKTQVGAQCEASGIAALAKVLYSLSYSCSAPSLHLRTLNPEINEVIDGDCMIATETRLISAIP